uniref:Thioredoxin domain-containing protein n=1 Tax=Trichobilharzia regenti TaxID=157069 RepID=A0AA85K913_TRIRE|nr:unnamed protein product [Trichobilharzia regenti]
MKSLRHALGFLLILLGFCSCNVIHLNSTNWKQMLEGEWFVKFHAPWCPACRQFSPIWEQLAQDTSTNSLIAEVDVTESPVLSFIFFIKRLPTLYHVKDGEFRVYDGLRTFDELKVYLKSQKYTSETPLPWYYSPASIHMQFFIRFMDLGILITNIHQSILDAGYRPWMSFLIIGLATVFSGLFIGLILVLVFDCFFPPRPQILRFIKKAESKKETEPDVIEKPASNGSHAVDGSGEHEDNDEATELRQRKVDGESPECNS